jgi:hypothetical protein
MDIFLSIIGQTKVQKRNIVLELHSFGDGGSSFYLIALKSRMITQVGTLLELL